MGLDDDDDDGVCSRPGGALGVPSPDRSPPPPPGPSLPDGRLVFQMLDRLGIRGV